jgi:hypothetical protein
MDQFISHMQKPYDSLLNLHLKLFGETDWVEVIIVLGSLPL